MESNKTFLLPPLLLLLPFIFSLLMIEKSMASRILAENDPPPDKDRSRIGVSGSVPKKDGSWNGDGSDQGMLLVPPPATKTTLSQAGRQNMSASAIVVAPTNAKVNVSTAVSPTSATSTASVTSSSSYSSPSSSSSSSSYSSASSSSSTSSASSSGYSSVTTVSQSSFTTVSQNSSADLTNHP